MEKKSKLISFTPKMGKDGQQRTYTPSGGKTLYYQVVVFENNDTGEAGSTSPVPKWSLNAEYTYNIESGQYGNAIKGMKEVGKEYNGGDKKKAWEPEDPNKDFFIAKMVGMEAATDFFLKLDQTQFTDAIPVKTNLISVANLFAEYIFDISSMPSGISPKQVRITRQNALKRAVEQADIPIFQIVSSMKVLERSKEIEKYLNQLPS